MDVLTTYVSKTTSSDAIMNWVGATLLPAAIILVLKIVGIFIIWFIGAKLIKLTRKIVRKMLGKGNVDKGVITFLDNFMKFALSLTGSSIPPPTIPQITDLSPVPTAMTETPWTFFFSAPRSLSL